MASICMSNCVKDAPLPMRPTYINLYRWPESDAEFVKTVSSNMGRAPHSRTTVVDSLSCRQTFLKSYTFSRKKEGVIEKTVKCLSRVRQTVVDKGKNKLLMIWNWRAKDASFDALVFFFRRLLSCSGSSASVDVADHRSLF